jgi:tRNA(Ile)-lysidine synthase TilS/MesJ
MSQDNTSETETEYYCERHELEEPPYPKDEHCPYCREERRVARARAEQAYVGHNMHPSVDARRR